MAAGGDALTLLLDKDSRMVTNPLSVWAMECIQGQETAQTNIGNQDSDNSTLYGNYLEWCKIHNVTPIKIFTFAAQLLAILQSNGIVAQKVRTMKGTVISGVIISNNKISNNAFALVQNPIVARMFMDFSNDGKLLEAPAVSVPAKINQANTRLVDYETLIDSMASQQHDDED